MKNYDVQDYNKSTWHPTCYVIVLVYINTLWVNCTFCWSCQVSTIFLEARGLYDYLDIDQWCEMELISRPLSQEKLITLLLGQRIQELHTGTISCLTTSFFRMIKAFLFVWYFIILLMNMSSNNTPVKMLSDRIPTTQASLKEETVSLQEMDLLNSLTQHLMVAFFKRTDTSAFKYSWPIKKITDVEERPLPSGMSWLCWTSTQKSHP